MITIQEFITENRIKGEKIKVFANPHMEDTGHKMNHWQVKLGKLTHPNDEMIVHFSMGLAHKKPPSTVDVLDCLASDAASIENASGFEDWASEFGYDTDSRRAQRTFEVCSEQSDALRKFLGHEAYKTLLWKVERL